MAHRDMCCPRFEDVGQSIRVRIQDEGRLRGHRFKRLEAVNKRYKASMSWEDLRHYRVISGILIPDDFQIRGVSAMSACLARWVQYLFLRDLTKWGI